jgi:Fe-S-cluster containining protein
MECRKGCGACCVAISISSPLPNMPYGKKAGVRCLNLSKDNTCSLHNTSDYPDVCKNLRPDLEMCGETNNEAFYYLEKLESLTSPDLSIVSG